MTLMAQKIANVQLFREGALMPTDEAGQDLKDIGLSLGHRGRLPKGSRRGICGWLSELAS
jgi:hypothetical protein